jgi:hypothetical protein
MSPYKYKAQLERIMGGRGEEGGKGNRGRILGRNWDKRLKNLYGHEFGFRTEGCAVGGFNVSNLMGIKRRMIDFWKKITFFFLQNV